MVTIRVTDSAGNVTEVTKNLVVSTPTPTGGNEKLAVRVFPQYTSKTYGNHAEVLDILGRLGVKRISGLLTPVMPSDVIQFYKDAYSRYGIKVWFAVGQPGDVLSDSQWANVRGLLSGDFGAGMVEIASGWNEPNHQVAGDWSTLTAQHQQKLWTNVQSVNASTGQQIKVGTPPLWSGSITEQYSDLTLLAPKIQGAYDTINWHLYPRGKTGADLADFLDTQVTKFVQAYGNIDIVNSESGYFTAENYVGGSNPSTEQEQAVQLPALAEAHLQRGISFSYFELLDDPDSTGANREAHFGLVRTPSLNPSTWSDKPAFETYRLKIAE